MTISVVESAPLKISGSRFFWRFILPKVNPAMVPIHSPLTTYEIVIGSPNSPIMRMTKYSLIIGEVIKNEKVTPKGTPALIKPIKIGTEEQEQKGVIAPKSAAMRLLKMPPPCIHERKRFSGSQVRKIPIKKIIAPRRAMIFIESYIKNSKVPPILESGGNPSSSYTR